MVSTQCSPAGPANVNRAAQRMRTAGLLAGLVFALLFAALGKWQLERAAFKDSLAERYASAKAADPVVLPVAEHAASADGLRVRASGRWLSERTTWLDNRTHQGRAGVHVITPLRLADGRWLFVDRGWAPLVASRTELPAPPQPKGDVVLQGVLKAPASGGFTLGKREDEGPLWSRLDLMHLRGQAAGSEVYPMVLELEDGAHDGLVRDWAPPAFGADKHRAYAAQWFSFALIALGLTAWSSWRALRSAGQGDSDRE